MKIVCISSTEPGLIFNKVYDTDHFTRVDRGKTHFTYSMEGETRGEPRDLEFYTFLLNPTNKSSYGGLKIDNSLKNTMIVYYRNENGVTPVYNVFISLEEYRNKTIENIIT